MALILMGKLLKIGIHLLRLAEQLNVIKKILEVLSITGW